jgi:hypothetical protein
MVVAHLQQCASHGTNPGPTSQKAVRLTITHLTTCTTSAVSRIYHGNCSELKGVLRHCSQSLTQIGNLDF